MFDFVTLRTASEYICVHETSTFVHSESVFNQTVCFQFVFCYSAETSLVIQCRLRALHLSPASGYLLWAGGSSQQCQQQPKHQTTLWPLRLPAFKELWPQGQASMSEPGTKARTGTEQGGAALPLCCSL